MSDDVIRDKHAAERLLGDPLLTRVFKELEEEFIGAWRNSETLVAREQQWANVHALDEVRRLLRGIVDRGAVEEHSARRR